MIYEINPLDNFFFRGPEPFEAGGETTVYHGGFPPLPSNYAGAFRTIVKDEQRGARGLKIGFNGLRIDGEFYFPLPRDLYITERCAQEQWKTRPMRLVKNSMSNYPLDYTLCVSVQAERKDKEQRILFASENAMRSYLAADFRDTTCTDIDGMLSREIKLGIKIDEKSGVSKDQHIYEILCVRPHVPTQRPEKGIHLAVDVQAELKKDHGVIKLGGEGKLAEFCGTDYSLDMEQTCDDSRYFKLYLATPAIFRNGWIPGWIDMDSKTGCFSFRKKHVKVRLISACVGKGIPCGGFGHAKVDNRCRYRPREQRFAVPAGSVYYFELMKGTFEEAVWLFHKKCVSDYREGLGFEYEVYNKSRYCDRGFGYSLVGRIGREQEEKLNVR